MSELRPEVVTPSSLVSPPEPGAKLETVSPIVEPETIPSINKPEAAAPSTPSTVKPETVGMPKERFAVMMHEVAKALNIPPEIVEYILDLFEGGAEVPEESKQLFFAAVGYKGELSKMDELQNYFSGLRAGSGVPPSEKIAQIQGFLFNKQLLQNAEPNVRARVAGTAFQMVRAYAQLGLLQEKKVA
ncbi:MAG: hypothetical protein ABI758_06450 [Candidatus Woesebacteria bacterium]